MTNTDPRVHKRARLGWLAAVVLLAMVLASTPLWQRPSTMDRPRPVTEASLSPTVLESLLKGRGLDLFLDSAEFADLKDCIDQSCLTRHMRNGISDFTLESTRETLQGLCGRVSNPFYAEFLLAKWYEVNQDPNQASHWMTQALAHAPVVLVRKYELMDGRPLANTPVGRLGVEYRLNTPTQSNSYLTLEYVHLTTDDKGQVYLPGFDTKIRCNSVEWPQGYEIETGRHGYLAPHARYNLLPTIYAWPKGVRRPATTLPTSMFYDYNKALQAQGLTHRVGVAEFSIDRCYRAGGDGQVTVGDGRKSLDVTQDPLSGFDSRTKVLDRAMVHFDRNTLKGHQILQVRVFDHRSRGLLTKYHAPADYEYDGDSSIVLRSLGQPLPERVDVWFWVTQFSPDQSAKILSAKAGSTVKFPQYSVQLISIRSGSHVDDSGTGTAHDGSHDREIEVVLKSTAQGQRVSKFGSAGGSSSERYARLALVTKAGKRHFSNYVFGAVNIQNTYSFDVPMSDLDYFELLPMGHEQCFYFDGVRLPERIGEPLDQQGVLDLDVNTFGKTGTFRTDTSAPIQAEFTVVKGLSSVSSMYSPQGLEDPRAAGRWEPNGRYTKTETHSMIGCRLEGLSSSMLKTELLDLSGNPLGPSSQSGHSLQGFYQSQAMPVDQIQGLRIRLSWKGLPQNSEH